MTAQIHNLPILSRIRVLDHYEAAYGPDLKSDVVSLVTASVAWNRGHDALAHDLRVERERLSSLRPGGEG